MPYAANWVGRGFVIHYTGEVGVTEMAAATRESTSDRRWDGLRWVLNDFRGVTSAEYADFDMRVLAATHSAMRLTNHRISVAAVTDRDDVREMLRAYTQSSFNKYDVQVVAEFEDAKAWLFDETGDEALREL